MSGGDQFRHQRREDAMRAMLLLGILILGIAGAQPAAAADVRLFVRHEVNDYVAWRKIYNEFDKTRRNLGVTAQAVYRLPDNPNDVTVIHDFKSMEQARAFIASPDLKTAMDKAGVKGNPQIWITSRAAK
jgi:quinol monooxygenase YgiN